MRALHSAGVCLAPLGRLAPACSIPLAILRAGLANGIFNYSAGTFFWNDYVFH